MVGVPGLFVLYFNNYDPNKYLKEYSISDGSLRFGKYQIRHIDWPDENVNENTLYVVSANSNPLSRQKMKKIKSIDLPNGEESFKIYSSR